MPERFPDFHCPDSFDAVHGSVGEQVPTQQELGLGFHTAPAALRQENSPDTPVAASAVPVRRPADEARHLVINGHD
ncbi:hypothetical protein MCAG_03403 [Micromonospora sp. ATCC 39149]|nr:hypothetical protein MCAG_03403 [Micromonospora sp. ATCC 39149]